MAIKSLYRAQAFGPGADMWVIPSKETSALVQKMDWYLNFQLARAHAHAAQEPAPQLLALVNENQLQSLTDRPQHPEALMIAAEHTFPTKTVVEAPLKNKKSWAEHIHNVWLQMGTPSLRVFLPNGIDAEEFKELWPGPTQHDVTVVPY